MVKYGPGAHLFSNFWFFFGSGILLSAIVAIYFPIENIMPAYFDLANSLPKGTAQFGFLPIGYSALIADWLGIGLENNIRLIQLLALWGTWIYLFFG